MKSFKLTPIILGLILAFFIPAEDVFAESVNVDFGSIAGGISSRIIQMVGLLTVLSIAPAILIMVTSFTRIVVVLSLLRTALGLQQTPPNQVLVSLALFLTFFIMSPTFQESYEKGLQPLMKEELDEEKALPVIIAPFRKFMLEHTREKDLSLFTQIAKIEEVKKEDLPTHIIIPSFMLSELKRAFEIGFLIFLPFLVIDMLVASVLMAMGMMMLPPVMISTPFKIIFFVLIDGWYMLCGSLVKSYGG
jgi:flagellar biosynthetic protein FliP